LNKAPNFVISGDCVIRVTKSVCNCCGTILANLVNASDWVEKEADALFTGQYGRSGGQRFQEKEEMNHEIENLPKPERRKRHWGRKHLAIAAREPGCVLAIQAGGLGVADLAYGKNELRKMGESGE